MKRKVVAFSVVAFAVAFCVFSLSAGSARACDNCDCGLTDKSFDKYAVAPVVALTYPEPYTGEPAKRGGLIIKVEPSRPRPAPVWPRWVPIRPAPPPRPVVPPPRPYLPPPRW